MAGVKKKDLIKAAKELNKVLGVDPPIDTDEEVDILKGLILKAGDLIEAGDDLSEETEATLIALQDEIGANEDADEEEEPAPPKGKKGKAAKADPPAPPAEAKPEKGKGKKADPAPESTKPAKAEKGAAKGKGKESAEPAKPAKAETPAPTKAEGQVVTKKSVIVGLLKTKNGATIEEMAKKIVDQGIDPDYEKNIRVVTAHLRKMGYNVSKAAMAANPKFKES